MKEEGGHNYSVRRKERVVGPTRPRAYVVSGGKRVREARKVVSWPCRVRIWRVGRGVPSPTHKSF